MDMRRKMNKPDIEYDDDACIIVLDYMSTRIGVFVEEVAYVADVDIETATENSVRNKEKFIKGMINDNGKTTSKVRMAGSLSLFSSFTINTTAIFY